MLTTKATNNKKAFKDIVLLKFLLELKMFGALSAVGKQSILDLLSDAHARENSGGELRKRRRKDPNAPKGAKTSFLFFSIEKRETLVKAGMNRKESLGECSRIWKGMSDEEKAPYNRLSDEDRLRYNTEMESRLTPTDLKNLSEKLEMDLLAITNDRITAEIERKMDIEQGNEALKGNESIVNLSYHRIPDAMFTRKAYLSDEMEEAEGQINQVLKALAHAAHCSNNVRRAAHKMAQKECEGLDKLKNLKFGE